MAQGPRFGTDGIRGRADTEITPALAYALGVAAAEVLGARRAVIGGDTRESTSTLDRAVAAGVISAGLEVVRVGVAPTPMIAFTASRLDAIGLVISASHNPYEDNGIKIFGVGGTKLPVETEERLAARLDEILSEDVAGDVHRELVLKEEPVPVSSDAMRDYFDHLWAALEGRDLAGLHLVVDAANGAASALVGPCFERLGAQVELINVRPDGRNINTACGATDPSGLAAAVLSSGADLGLALDGDADRLIAVDERGQVVDGDHIIALCARDLKNRDRLAQQAVAVTVMTNLGFHQAMRDAGIRVVATPVGDRSVLEAMDAGGLSLGGEQSGHVIFRDFASTGDGMLTGLMLADVLVRASSGRAGDRLSVSLSELAGNAMTALPQILINVKLPVVPPQLLTEVAPEIAAVESRLGDAGRLLVRISGTEPMVRVMVEAPTVDQATIEAEGLADLIRARYMG
jgi:phosphoglucosamine mutase